MRVFIQNISLLLFSVIALSCSRYTAPPVSGTSAPAPASVSGSMENSILANINAHRRLAGLPALHMVDAASLQAYTHSKNMATGKTAFSHDGFSQRITAIQKIIGQTSASAENVAYGSLSAKEVVNVWVNSPAHRKNMEGSYNLTGIGVAKDRDGTLYFTQIFLRK